MSASILIGGVFLFLALALGFWAGQRVTEARRERGYQRLSPEQARQVMGAFHDMGEPVPEALRTAARGWRS